MSHLRHPALHWVLAILVGGVFVYASLAKIADPNESNGDGTYWVTTTNLAHWMGTRGYSA